MARLRVIVMTDIANEPDDQISLVRFLLYSNQLDVEGLVDPAAVERTYLTWMRKRQVFEPLSLNQRTCSLTRSNSRS